MQRIKVAIKLGSATTETEKKKPEKKTLMTITLEGKKGNYE